MRHAIWLAMLLTIVGCSNDSTGTPTNGLDASDTAMMDVEVPDSDRLDQSSPDLGAPDLLRVDDMRVEDLGAPDPATSCLGASAALCAGGDCCATSVVPGGWFAMGRGEGTSCAVSPQPGADCTTDRTTCAARGRTWGCPEGRWLDLGDEDQSVLGHDDEVPEHATFVSGFHLDRFEVTVGRMREFVSAYDKPALAAELAAGLGAHPRIPESRWRGEWDSRLPDNLALLRDALMCDPSQTWTNQPGANETAPINCVSWYLAYAFCAWDGGRLPTAAEWERAAAGGDHNRINPWGNSDPTAAEANFLDTDDDPFVPVDDRPAGAGRWGHEGLGGSMWEWVLDSYEADWYLRAGADCSDCANIVSGVPSTMRGGSWQYGANALRAAERFPGTSAAFWLGAGVRCARD